MSDEPVQLFVRTDKGATYGPLAPTSIELLLDAGVVTGRVQISLDGLNYVFPGRVPGIRMAFPRALWGDVIEPGDEADALWSKAVLPPTVGAAAPPSASRSTAGSGAPLAAGPGARAQANEARPANRPSGISRPPGVSSPSAVASALRAAAPMISGPVVAAVPAAEVPSAPAPAPAAEEETPVLDATVDDPSGEFAELATDPGETVPGGGNDPSAYVAEQIAPTGQLSQVGPVRLYFLAAATDRTGLLTLTLADRVIQVHFRKGTPEFVDSNHAEDGLAIFLIRKQLLTAEVISQAEAQKANFGGELLPALFGLGLLNPNTVFAHLGQRAADLVYRALIAENGTYTFKNAELSPTKAMPMGHKWGVFVEQLRRVPGAEVRRRMTNALDNPVMKGSGPVPATDLRLSPQELRALNHFDGVRSLNQLMTQLPAEAEVMLRTAWVLQFCDVVSFAAAVLKNEPAPNRTVTPVTSPVAVPQAPSGARGPPVSAAAPSVAAKGPNVPGNPAAMNKPQTVTYPTTKPKPVPPPVMHPSAGAAAAQAGPVLVPGPPKISATMVGAPVPQAAASPAVVKQLTDTLEAMRTQNYFEVLSIAKDVDPGNVKVAYFKLAKLYHPDTIPHGTPVVIVKLKADIFARVADAYRTISDAKLRAEYAAELAAGGTGEKVDIAKILAAEEFFQKGTILVKARKFTEAVKLFTEAINASDVEAEYYAWRGWAKFFLYADKAEGRVEALKDISICAKKNPNIAAMYYFQGYMAKVLGDLASAKTNFTRTVQLDPRHIDAQRELRMMK